MVVLEPKGDLIADLLERIQPDRIQDVVLIDPTDTERPVGLNPLQLAGRSPELVADQLLGLFHSLYASSWGPRTADILGASLLTLARLPNMSLAALPLLLTDAGFRRRVLAQVDDPIGLGPFWASFEAWSEAERTTAIAPSLQQAAAATAASRTAGRHRAGQAPFRSAPGLHRAEDPAGQPGSWSLGPETAALLGSLIMSQLWQAILGRSAIAPERRHPVFIYVDEFQDYLRLPLDFADALAQARGLGAGFVLADQYHAPARRGDSLGGAGQRPVAGSPSGFPRGRPDHRRRQHPGPRGLPRPRCVRVLRPAGSRRGRATVVQRAHPATEPTDQRSRRSAGSFPCGLRHARARSRSGHSGAGCSEAPESH